MSLPGNRSRWWLVLMVLLLTTVAGANWFFYFRNVDRSSAALDASALQDAEPAGVVVCFGHVDVEYGVQSLSPVQSGRVIEVAVREYAEVKAGDVLLRLDDRQAQNRQREADADLSAAQAQLTLAEKAVEQHPSRLAQQKEAVVAARKRLSAALHALERKQQLLKIQQISKEEVGAADDQVKELEAAVRAENHKLREFALNDPELLVSKAGADVSARQARLDQAQQALDECTLRAPADGEVLRVLVGPGDVLGNQSKQLAILFSPDKPRFIRAEVAQEFADRVKAGMPARIHNDANDSGVWHGSVQRISSWYTQRRSTMHEPLQVNDVRTLECIVTIDSGPTPLRIGQRMRVTIGEE